MSVRYIVGDRDEGMYLTEYRVYNADVVYYGKIIGREFASSFPLEKARQLADQHDMKVYEEVYTFTEVYDGAVKEQQVDD